MANAIVSGPDKCGPHYPTVQMYPEKKHPSTKAEKRAHCWSHSRKRALSGPLPGYPDLHILIVGGERLPVSLISLT